MKPRLVEVGKFQQIIKMGALKDVAVFFYGSENVMLFGHENVLDQVVDEMIYSLGYVPRYIRKEIVNDRERLAHKLDMAIKSTIITA